MTQAMLASGQPPRHPQSILQEDFMERMGRELVRLCDSMERHGLVDYQMGVWEEEIINGMSPYITSRQLPRALIICSSYRMFKSSRQ